MAGGRILGDGRKEPGIRNECFVFMSGYNSEPWLYPWLAICLGKKRQSAYESKQMVKVAMWFDQENLNGLA